MRILAPSPRNGLKLFWHGDGSVSVVRPAAKSATAILAMDAARSPRLARDNESDGSSSLERLMSFLQDRLNPGDMQAVASMIDQAISEHIAATPGADDQDDLDGNPDDDQPPAFAGRPERAGGLTIAQDAKLRAHAAATKSFYDRFPALKGNRVL